MRHALEVGTLRTLMQEKVSTERLVFASERWHNANMGLRIRILRKERGLTGEQLAEMVDVTKGYISELENGKKLPGADLLMRLAEALHCEVYDLFEGTKAARMDSALRAHLEVMEKLPKDKRHVIEMAAQGLLAKLP